MLDQAVTIAVLLLHASAIVAVLLTERREPTATLAWLLTLVFLPVIGLVLYLLIGTRRFRSLAARTAESAERIAPVLARHDVAGKLERAAREAPTDAVDSLLRLGRGLGSTRASGGNRAEILVNGAATYRATIQAIESARHHVHLETYIIRDDATGRALRDRLARRAAEGVAVRVLFDSVGSSTLPSDFWRPLSDAGGRVAAFRPVLRVLTRVRRRDRIDFRNHRKIVVADGRTGFTGGINVGREYLGLDPEIGRWRDTHVRLQGPAVLSLQRIFLTDWLLATGELLDDPAHFPEPDAHAGGAVVQIVDSGPDRPWSPIAHLFTQAIALARQRVWITNPYFIPSPTIRDSLVAAALRGVDVKVLLPSRSDSLVVTLASRSYYPELIEAGVAIHEYERGFVHAKTMVVDGWAATIGSANMDLRSFDLNFEINAFVYDAPFVGELARIFRDDLRGARRVEAGDDERRPLPVRLVRAAARLASPLL